MNDEDLLLAVLNTTPNDGTARSDQLRGAEGVRWLVARGEVGTAEERDALIEARDVLQNVVRDGADPGDLACFLRAVTVVPVIENGVLTWIRRLPPGREVATRAVLAWGALEQNYPNRLRACANPQCERFLIDRSRPNQAKWCSMAVCGNRAKARRHYQRARAEQ